MSVTMVWYALLHLHRLRSPKHEHSGQLPLRRSANVDAQAAAIIQLLKSADPFLKIESQRIAPETANARPAKVAPPRLPDDRLPGSLALALSAIAAGGASVARFKAEGLVDMNAFAPRGEDRDGSHEKCNARAPD